jgi:uncharacterized protein YkwD
MPSLPRPIRAAVPCALVAATVAVLPGPAVAAEPVLPQLPICVQTEVLPAIGDCRPAPTPAPVPADKPAKGACKDADLVPAATNLSRIRTATLCLLNKERTKRGRRKLRSQGTLAGVARRYAGQMVREGFFDHVSPGGSTMLARIKATAYLRGDLARWSVGENLAWATSRLATPKRTVRAWMDSPGHRRNILDRSYAEIGIGVVTGIPTGDAAGATYVTEFGLRVRR